MSTVTSGALAYGVALVACGAAALGVGAGVLSRAEQLGVLSQLWSRAGGSGASAVALLKLGTLAGGAVAAAGLVAFGAHFAKRRAILVMCMVLAVAAGVLQIVAVVKWSGLVASSKGELFTETAYSFAYSSEQHALLDSSLAVFNKCCYERYINDTSIPAVFKKDVQSAILPCPTTKGLDPMALPVCAPLPAVVSLLGSKAGMLCTCYTPSFYDPVYAAIDSNTCAALGAINVPVGKTLTIPVVGLTVDGVLKATQFESYLPVEDMQMTGMPAPRDPPSLNGDGVMPTPPTGTNAKEGFNCGLGYAKGIVWISSMFLEQTAGAAPVVFLIVAAVQLFATALLAAYWVMGSGDAASAGQDWLETYEPNKGRGQNEPQVAP